MWPKHADLGAGPPFPPHLLGKFVFDRDTLREIRSPSGGCHPGAFNSAADNNQMMATDVVKTMKTSGSSSSQRRSDKLSSASSSRSSANTLISRARRGSKSSLGSLLEQY